MTYRCESTGSKRKPSAGGATDQADAAAEDAFRGEGDDGREMMVGRWGVREGEGEGLGSGAERLHAHERSLARDCICDENLTKHKDDEE